MTVQIFYKNNDNSNNQVLFVEESYNINSIKKHVSSADLSYIKEILKNNDLKKKILSLDLNSKKRLILVSVKKKLESSDIENLGADFYNFIKTRNINKLSIISNTLNFRSEKDFIGHFLHGLKLKSYEFNIYKTKKEKKIILINVIGKKNNSTIKNELKFKALEEGTFFTRDLVSEPGNILHPDEYAKRLVKLKKYGLKVTVYDKKKLKKLGLNALLGVGQGSIRGSYLVTIEWKGSKSKSKPLGFVGKGVCFDTGGISLIKIIKSIVPPLVLIIAVLGSILGGIATPTEAAGVGAMGAILLAALRGNLSLQNLNEIVISSTKTTAMVFFILIGASIFSLVFRGYGGDELVTDIFNLLPGGVYGALFIVMLVIFLLGFIIFCVMLRICQITLKSPTAEAT